MLIGNQKVKCNATASMFMLAVLFLHGTIASAQNRKGIEANRLAVDVVSVLRLGRLHGIVLNQDSTSVSIAVRRDWLKTSYPEFAKKHFVSEVSDLKTQRDKLKKRIEAWRNEYKGDDRAVIEEFLDENEELLELDQPIDTSGLEYTVVKLERQKVRKVYLQTPEKHRLAGIAWSEKIPNVESTNTKVLKRKLVEKNINIAGYDLQLGNEIPPVLESDTKWEMRKALVEFAILKRVEFQGTGTMFLPRGANADPMEAVKALLQGGAGLGGFSQLDQLGRDLGLPEFKQRNTKRQDKDAWLKPMIAAAEKANRRTFSVAKMTQGDSVTVDMQLYGKAPDERWYQIAQFSNRTRLAEISTDDLDVVKQDPNVSRMLDMMKQFGVANEGLIDKALKSGAATKLALDKSMSQLDEFVEQYSYEIDNPPVELKR